MKATWDRIASRVSEFFSGVETGQNRPKQSAEKFSQGAFDTLGEDGYICSFPCETAGKAILPLLAFESDLLSSGQ